MFGALFAVLTLVAIWNSRRAATLAKINNAAGTSTPAPAIRPPATRQPAPGAKPARKATALPAPAAASTRPVRSPGLAGARAVSGPVRPAAPADTRAVPKGHPSRAAAPERTEATARIMARVGRIAPYFVLLSAAFLPLAAGLYLVTTTAWSAAENTLLRRGLPA